jgi:multidrug efflux pump subunit AcrA (membrane-fusion protein)
MQTWKSPMRMLTAFTFLAVLSVAAFFLLRAKSVQLAHHTAPQMLPIVLEAVELRPGPAELTLPVSADAQALRESIVSSRITAYVKELPLYEGQRFSSGQLLAVLDQSQVRADLLRAEASLAQTRLQRETLAADLAAAQSNLMAAEAKARRAQSLYEHQNVSLEKKETDEATLASTRAKLSAANVAVQSYDTLLEANAAQVDAARENLTYTSIAAPYAGVVSQRLAQPGDLVTPGKPLLKITDPSAGLRLIVSVPETFHPVALKLAGQRLPLAPWPEASPQGLRRFEARGQQGNILPGERVAAALVLYEAGEALLIPNSALLNDDGRTGTVLLVSGGATAPSEAAPHHHTAQDRPPPPEGKPAEVHHGPMRIEALPITLEARGAEGAVTRDPRLAGRALLLGSPDLLGRVQAGAPFRVQQKQE